MRKVLATLALLASAFIAAPASASVRKQVIVPMPFVMDAVPFTGGSSYEQGWRTVIKPIPVKLANIHVPGGKSTSGGTGIICNVYAGDNGCTATKTAQQSNGTSIVPFWQDTDFIYNHATSGQTPSRASNPSGFAAAAAIYSTFLHGGNYNIEYWDYAIGSADPTTLNPIDQFNVLNPLDTFCTYFPAGTGPKAGVTPTIVNYLNCSITSPTVTYTALQGFDWMYCSIITNCPGQATGHGNSTTILFLNVTASANSPTVDKRNNRFGETSAVLHTASPFFDYWTISGNFVEADSYETIQDGWNDLNIPNNTGLNAHHVMQDSRTSTATVAGWATTWSYIYIQGLSRDPSVSGSTGNNGDFTVQYSVADGLGMDCADHVEWLEQGGLGIKANYHYVGTMYIGRPTKCTGFDITSPQYGPGAGNGTTYGTLEIGNTINIHNTTNGCSNTPPYNADNPCGTPGSGGGNAGLLNLDLITSVDQLTLYGNIVDDHIGVGVYANQFGQNGLGGLFSATVSITSSGGQSQLNVWGLSNGINPQNWITPGSSITWLSGTAPAGWVDPAASNPNTGTNPSTLVGLAKFQGTWCNIGCTGAGTLLTTSVPINLVEHTAGFTCSLNVAGCINFTNSYGYGIGGILGFAISDNCGGVQPCASYNMSASQNSLGTANFRTDNYNDPAGAVGCQPGIFPNCGYFAFNIAEPVTAGPIPVGTNTIINYATVGALTISAPTYYATGPTGTWTYTAPKTVTFSPLTPGAQSRVLFGSIN